MNSMSDPVDFERHLEMFFGKTSDAVGYVYAQLGSVPSDGLWRLSGSLLGPFCRYAQTLSARSTFADAGQGESVLAMAAVPEPCFWTPEMPHLYEAEIALHYDDEEVAVARRIFGFRNLGVAGGKLLYDGKRWNLRAVSAAKVPPTELAEWREASAAMLVRDPTDAVCDDASRLGVLLMAETDSTDAAELRRLGRWPAVGGVLVPGDSMLPIVANDMRHNLVIAQRFDTTVPIHAFPGVAAAAIDVRSTDELLARIANVEVALLGVRQGGSYDSVFAARAACDALQRDLAGHGDWSGYIV